MLNSFSHRQILLVIFAITTAILLGAYGFEYMGYAPCELCLMQRYAYYAVIPLSLILSLLDPKSQKAGLYLIGLIMFGSMIFGIYHSGYAITMNKGRSIFPYITFVGQHGLRKRSDPLTKSKTIT